MIHALFMLQIHSRFLASIQASLHADCIMEACGFSFMQIAGLPV